MRIQRVFFRSTLSLTCFSLGATGSASAEEAQQTCSDVLQKALKKPNQPESAEAPPEGPLHQFIEFQKKYWAEVHESRGLRLFLKDSNPEVQDLERRFLFFTKHSDEHRFHFNLFEGFDHAANLIPRKTSEKLVERGKIKNPKQFSSLALSFVTAPFIAPFFDTPLHGLREMADRHQEETLGKMLASDIRLRGVAQQLEKDLRDIERLKTESRDFKESDLKEIRRRAWQQVYENIRLINDEYEKFFVAESKYEKNIKDHPEKKLQLREAYLKDLSKTPLFHSVLTRLGVKNWEEATSNPDRTHALKHLLILRAHLFHTYDLIPHVLKHDPAYEHTYNTPQGRKLIDRIEKSPVYAEIKTLLEKNQISQEKASLVLMYEAYWIHEGFGFNSVVKSPSSKNLPSLTALQSALIENLKNSQPLKLQPVPRQNP